MRTLLALPIALVLAVLSVPVVWADAWGLEPDEMPYYTGPGPELTPHRIACTSSMFPAITCMDEVWINEEFRPAELSEGDVIAFHTGSWSGSGTLHRIIAVFSNNTGRYSYLTKGDNNPVADGRIPMERVIGVVERIAKCRNKHEQIVSGIMLRESMTKEQVLALCDTPWWE